MGILGNNKKERRTVLLDTPFGMSNEDWSIYPRPQMKREIYASLCGMWELSVIADGKENSVGNIKVPFSPESKLSGVCRELKSGEKYVYRKSFSIDRRFEGKRVVLHFGAVDQIARVFVNGIPFEEHIGGYLPFEFDITDALVKGDNLICVEVEDELDRELAYGKQTRNRGGMWYTAISGIWQPVWLEGRPAAAIEKLRITSDLCGANIMTVGGENKKHICVSLPNGTLELDYEGDHVRIDLPEPMLWSPETPYLYNFVLSAGEDRIESYFALRTVDIGTRGGRSYILLNGEPYFFHGLLDQGYYSDGIYTPASPEGYRYDILKMKELGFNMLRKHIKIEPDIFYYYCDKYGMIVFQDMVNSGKYSFLIDTALPTVALRSKVTHRASKKRREHFEGSARETADILYNHPSVCYYTIFNEGWGQYDADRIYSELKAYDPTRVWDATSGWFKQKYSDVESEHIYFKKVKLRSRPDRPLVLSEFGGYSMRVEGHCFDLDKSYGYKTLDSSESLSRAIEELYLGQIVPEIEKNGLCATVLTQVSDVEDEINGILTYDRKVLKTDAETMKNIAQILKARFGDIAK